MTGGPREQISLPFSAKRFALGQCYSACRWFWPSTNRSDPATERRGEKLAVVAAGQVVEQGRGGVSVDDQCQARIGRQRARYVLHIPIGEVGLVALCAPHPALHEETLV